jgi:hypothetical protein
MDNKWDELEMCPCEVWLYCAFAVRLKEAFSGFESGFLGLTDALFYSINCDFYSMEVDDEVILGGMAEDAV